ncbi:GNAT family N-acetyltransferase [Candidatus Saganbacteria bacterium]|nr:GNAT family N-acetyltransferase [Candidatus Saganbacteria bacterium]
MDYSSTPILLPIGWSRPNRTHFTVAGRPKGAVQVRYREKSFEMRAQSHLLSRHLALTQNGATVGGIGWSETPTQVALNGLKVDPAFQGRGLGKLLAWCVLKLARESGCVFDQARAQGVMEEVEDLAVDPRAALLFAKMGFNCLEPGVQEEASSLMRNRCAVVVCGKEPYPHFKLESPAYGMIRVALMTPEGSMTKSGPSRGLLQDREHYQYTCLFPSNLSEVVSRGAAYISGDYWLNPQYAGFLIEEIERMPALGI